jgi:predicted regulator of Ras-like GTPase activity (Roadblock/LC7/MglB family)/predicted Zn-dependent protease
VSDDIRRWSDALAADPASRVFLPLGEALRRRGQLDPALKVAVRGLERHPYDADAHDLLARIWVDRGETQRARDEWSAALRCAPDHAGALKGTGFLSFTEGKLAEAEDYLGRAARVDTEDATIRTALARVRAMRGTPPESDGVPRTTVTPAHRETSRATSSAMRSSDPRELFADLVSSGDQAALLLDADGLVLAGAYAGADGRDVGAEVGAALTGVSDEAQRAMRHLNLGDWSTITVETEAAVVAVAPMPDDGLALVAAARSVPQGLVRRTLSRVSERGGAWLANWDGGEP